MSTTVFISSTSRDLLDHRAAVARALLNAGYHPIDMANFMARPDGAVRACLQEVAESDLFVGIYAWRYGFIPAGAEVSITEMEFVEAQKLGKPCFCFIVDEDYPWPAEHKEEGHQAELLRRFKARIDATLVRTTFTTPDNLASRVLASLQRWERDSQTGVPAQAESPPLPYEPETILIPAGPFLMGSDEDEADEVPQHEVKLPPYRIGKYPVTNAQYAEFIKREKQQDVPKKAGWFLREPPADKLDHPVVGVSWQDARLYGQWLSEQTGRAYRLPTEAEWEKAASWTGEQKRRYSWGDEFDPSKANTGELGLGDTTPVGHYSPQGDSPAGCADIVGNVQEWTSTLWGSDLKETLFPYPYQAQDGREDLVATHLHRVYRVHRGGSFRDAQAKVHCSARGCSDPDSKIRWRGFRVVLDV